MRVRGGETAGRAIGRGLHVKPAGLPTDIPINSIFEIFGLMFMILE